MNAELVELEDDLVAVAGLPGLTSRAPDSVLFSRGVRTDFGRPEKISAKSVLNEPFRSQDRLDRRVLRPGGGFHPDLSDRQRRSGLTIWQVGWISLAA